MPNLQKIKPTPYPENTDIGIDEMSVTYIQNADTNDDSDHFQRLTITTVGATDDGYYVNVSIPNFDDGEPGHWSLDMDEGIEPMLQDFKERLGINKNEQNT